MNGVVSEARSGIVRNSASWLGVRAGHPSKTQVVGRAPEIAVPRPSAVDHRLNGRTVYMNPISFPI